MKSLLDFDGVLFDLDGVITDTAKFHYLGWKKLSEELGIDFTESDNEKLKGVDRITSLERILELGGIQLPLDKKKDLAAKKNAYYLQYVKSISEKDILPGVVEALTELKGRGRKLAIASASQNAPTIIKNLGLGHYFDHVADASLARSKPAPDIFLFAAYGLDLHSSQCIGVEDSVAGLQAIQSASMYAVGVGGDELSAYANYVVKDFTASGLI